jgi:hypothetical protein
VLPFRLGFPPRLLCFCLSKGPVNGSNASPNCRGMVVIFQTSLHLGSNMKRLVLTLLLLVAPAFADSFKITGTAVLGDDSEDIQIMGATFSANSGALTAPTFSGYCQNVCTVFTAVTTAVFYSSGSLNGVVGDPLDGYLQFSSKTFSLSDFQNGTFSQPVTFFGQISGLDSNTGATLWTVQLKGTGTANYELFLSGPNIISTYWTFAGTAAVAPEPSTLLMIGTGLGLPLLIAPRRLLRLLWRV